MTCFIQSLFDTLVRGEINIDFPLRVALIGRLCGRIHYLVCEHRNEWLNLALTLPELRERGGGGAAEVRSLHVFTFFTLT